MISRSLSVAVCAMLSIFFAANASSHDRPGPPSNPFVTRVGANLYLGREQFRFAGANNYYPMYKSRAMTDAVLDKAAANGFRVMRFWGSLEIGNQDGSNSVDGMKEGVYLQYWDGSRPAYNDGESGLARLDYIVAQAGKKGIRLVFPLVNNWNAFGGMDQYVRWRGGQFHDDFYTDPVIKGWYKDWISHLMNRVNSITGVAYKNDPTIMMWELGNEPRCLSAGVYPRSPGCTTQTLVSWADEMSTYIKSVDRNHLVSVGDEGFLCVSNPQHWTEGCGDGVDSYAFAALRNIDAMSLHLYPDSWGTTPAWGTEWITRHIKLAKSLHKAVYVGEYGLRDKAIRNTVYRDWTRAAFFGADGRGGADGALYWILSDLQDGGALYPDYDGFTVYCPSPVCITERNFAARMVLNFPFGFPPVADDDTAVTPFATAVSLTPASNDIAYLGRQPLPSTIDLDPDMAGQQISSAGAAGIFALQTDGTVKFTPADGFQGEALANYRLSDTAHRKSNVAALRVKVLADPNAALLLYSFENDAQGWAPASWQANAGVATRVTDFATQGAASLQVAGADGGWFGLNVADPVLDLSAKTHFKFDLRTLAAGSSLNIAIQGREWVWCQGNWGFQNPGSTATVDFDLTALTAPDRAGAVCPISDFSDVNAIWVFVSGAATVNIDNVRVE